MKKTMDLKKMVTAALLIALIVVLGLTPLGYIPIGPIAVTTLCLPIIIGTYLLGLRYGLLLGFVFGLTSFYKALTAPDPLLACLVAYPLALYPSIFIPRLLIPVVAFLTQKATSKLRLPVSVGITAVAGSLTNTIFFLGFVFALGAQPIAQQFGMSVPTVGKTLTLAGVTNGLPEAVVAALLCIPVIAVLKKAVYR